MTSSSAVALPYIGAVGVRQAKAVTRRALSVVPCAPTPVVDIGLVGTRTASAPASARTEAKDRARSLPDFRTMFESQCGYVWSTLLRLGVRPADVEDVAHEVFLTVHRRQDDYDASRPIRPWIFGISLRAALRYRNLARNRREVLPGDYDITDETESVEERIAGAQERRMLVRGLEQLSVDRRAVLVMHDIDGLAMPEIARELAIPLNTAYSRLRLARADLKAAVNKLRGPE